MHVRLCPPGRDCQTRGSPDIDGLAMFAHFLKPLLGKLIAVMIGCAFVAVSVACAQNCQPGDDPVCAIDRSVETGDADHSGDSSSGDRTVHACGGCHIHMIRQDAPRAMLPVLHPAPATPWVAEAILDPPLDLFRPPRA